MTEDSHVGDDTQESPSLSQVADPPRDGGKWPGRPSLWISGSILALLLWFASGWVLLVGGAVLAATCLRGAALAVAGRSRLGVNQGIVVVLVGGLVLSGLLGVLVLPAVDNQARELAERFPQMAESWQSAMEGSAWGVWLRERIPGEDELSEVGGALLERVGGAFSSVFGFFVNGFLLTVIALYLAFEAPRYERGFTRMFPARRREVVTVLLEKLGATIRGWVLGQLFSMGVLGVLVYLGLSLLGVPLALLMAVFTALLTFIPNLGPVISVIPPVMLALTQSPWLALWVLLFYICVQLLEGNFLTPMAMRTMIQMPPALLLAGQVLLASLLGFWGLVLAAPMSAVGMVLVEELHLKQMDEAE